MALEKTSSGIVETFVGNAINKSFYTLVEASGSERLVFQLFVFSWVFTFYLTLGKFLNFLLRVHAFGNDVDGSVDNDDKGVKRELVEGMDLIELNHEEEHEGSSAGSWSIGLRGIIDHDLCNLGNLDLLLDLG